MENEKRPRTYKKRTTQDDGSFNRYHGSNTGSMSDSNSTHTKRDRSLETKAIEEKIDAFFEANKETGLRKL